MYVHNQVQAVVHGVFQPLLQLANKKKRKDASRVLPGLVNMVSDLEVTLSAAAAAQVWPMVAVVKLWCACVRACVRVWMELWNCGMCLKCRMLGMKWAAFFPCF